MASNFNNDVDPAHTAGRGADTSALADRPDATPPSAPPERTPVVSDAVIKFRSCRWRRPPDEGVECCGHRDVLPLAGTTSFDPEAWCPDCTYFKLRRSPKKRPMY